MIELTNKWQCSKCKKLKKVSVRTKIIKIQKQKKKTIHPNDVKKIKCCCRVMRNLTDKAFETEEGIEKSGIRGNK